MVILLGVLFRSGPIKRFLSETLISLTWSCQPLEDSWPRFFSLLLSPDLSVEKDEEEQAAMSNMAIDIDYLE